MKIDKTGRDTLKSYFVKNAVPTASNFEDLINAGINQREDGIAKLPGEPLSLQADGDDASQKKLLNLYRSFNDLAPAWALALNPRANPADPASANAGFSIGDANGVSRLFIDQATGRLGVGTVKPAMQLDVAGVVRFMANHNANKDPDSRLQYGGNLVLKGNAPQLDFLDTDNNEWAIHVNSNKMYFIREPWAATDLVLDGAGNIGMGTDAPRAKLEVRGGAIMPSFGPGEDAGLFFPPDAAGGSGDRAWLRYYTRGGESTTLELGIANDADDHIALMASGNVGIGTREPVVKLDVAGAMRIKVEFNANRDPDSKLQYGGSLTLKGNAPQIDFIDTDHNDWAIHVNSNKMYFIREPWVSTDLVLDGAGRIGMGTADPQATLDVRGTARVNALQLGDRFRLSGVPDGGGATADDWLRLYNTANTGYAGGLAAGRLWCTALGQLSDQREKEDIEALRQSPDDLLMLRAVQFRWRNGQADAEPTMGLIAQEVAAVYPDAVSVGPDGMLGINYSLLVVPLIEAVKQQQARMDALLARLAGPAGLPAAA